eukprot:3263632-Rhodomonas_salina.1
MSGIGAQCGSVSGDNCWECTDDERESGLRGSVVAEESAWRVSIDESRECVGDKSRVRGAA